MNEGKRKSRKEDYEGKEEDSKRSRHERDREKTSDKSKDRSERRHRDREKRDRESRRHEREKSCDSDVKLDREREKHRYKDKDRTRVHDEERERARDKKRERDREDRERERRDRREKEREKERERERDRRERGREREVERERVRRLREGEKCRDIDSEYSDGDSRDKERKRHKRDDGDYKRREQEKSVGKSSRQTENIEESPRKKSGDGNLDANEGKPSRKEELEDEHRKLDEEMEKRRGVQEWQELRRKREEAEREKQGKASADEPKLVKEENGRLKYQIYDKCQIYDECKIYRGSIKWVVPTKDKWEEKEEGCSAFEADDENTAKYLLHIYHKFGVAAVKVYTINGCYVVLEEITSCFSDWYLNMYRNYPGDRGKKYEWWKYIESGVRKLFGGVIKSLSKLYPDLSHGNMMRGIAVFDGQARLFNMKHPGIDGYKNDRDCLHCMISNMVEGVSPEKFKELDVDDYMAIEPRYCSTDFKTFLRGLSNFERVNIYTPFFWIQDQKINFLRGVHDLFWGLKDGNQKNVMKLESCFNITHWHWMKSIPAKGPFREVFKVCRRNDGMKKIKRTRMAYSIVFWRHCITHYNDHVSKKRTIEQISIELHQIINILDNVFQAVSEFIKRNRSRSHDDRNHDRVVFERMVALRDMPTM